MADLQVGNHMGVAARGQSSQALGTVVANGGANSLVLSATTWQKLRVGMPIDCYSAAGVARFTGRNINSIVVTTGAVAYSGADAPTVAAGDLVYYAGARTNNAPSNVNGGVSDRRGFRLQYGDTIEEMRFRLNEINPTYYTAARLNGLTSNDMVYALRLAEEPLTI